MNFIDLTQFVKQSLLADDSEGDLKKDLQFQVFKCFAQTEGLWLYFDFYPGQRFLLAKEGCLKVEKTPPGKAVELPLRLYLKSHFINKRLLKAEVLSSVSARLSFSILGFQIEIKKENDFLEMLMKVPEKKDFRQRMKLASGLPYLESLGQVAPDQAPGPAPAALVAIPSLTDKKNQKLLSNIRNDLLVSSEWIQNWSPAFSLLLEHPEWGDKEILEKFRELLLPEWKSLPAKNVRDYLFKKKKKLEKRRIGTQKRLLEVEKKLNRQGKLAEHGAGVNGVENTVDRGIYPENSAPKNSQAVTQKSAEIRPSDTPEKPQKKPGIWVELGQGLWARIGKSAMENSELFRQAKDRDLWFHVRGQKGAHVWVPRGQKGFGAKDEAPDWLIQKGCELAAFNSKIKEAGSADCDFTERRYLRAIKGAGPGQLEILRSKTRFVRIKN